MTPLWGRRRAGRSGGSVREVAGGFKPEGGLALPPEAPPKPADAARSAQPPTITVHVHIDGRRVAEATAETVRDATARR
jgi:hypothetical protein